MIKRNLYFLVGLVLTASLLWPLFVSPLFTHHDDVQIIRLFEMDKCIKDGQIPCRWVPDLGGLYGYPLFNYYAPLPYYFGEIFNWLTNNLITSVKIMFISAFVGSFVFMYLLARKFFGQLGASLAAIFYAFAPYHAVDFYVRGAMGEMWGLMFFPALFWALVRLSEQTNIINVLLSGILIATLITAHNLSAAIFLPIGFLFVIVLYIRKRNRRFLLGSFFSLTLGILLSAFYLIPMVFEKNLVHVETTTIGYFSYTEHFKGLRKLILDRSWGYGGSVREVPGGEKDTLPYQIGWVHLFGLLLSLYVVRRIWKNDPWIAKLIVFSLSIILLSIFLINPRSEFVWKMIEPMKYLQFPWRFLMIIIFFISFISGSIFLLIKDTGAKRWWIGLVVAVVAANFFYFRPEKFINISQDELLRGSSWERQIKRSIFDYLPKSAKEPPAELASSRYQILTGDSRVYDFAQGTNWIKFKTETNSHTIIRLSQYYFPQWKITVDGKEIVFDYENNNLGLMTIILGKGNHDIQARLYNTTIRTVANFITVVGFGLTAILFLVHFKGVRKWILYYRRRIN